MTLIFIQHNNFLIVLSLHCISIIIIVATCYWFIRSISCCTKLSCRWFWISSRNAWSTWMTNVILENLEMKWNATGKCTFIWMPSKVNFQILKIILYKIWEDDEEEFEKKKNSLKWKTEKMFLIKLNPGAPVSRY